MIFEVGKHEATLSKIGGKAFQLAHLSKTEGICVPKWFALTTDCFCEFLGENRTRYTQLLENYSEDSRREILDIIEHTEFSGELRALITAKLQEYFPTGGIAAVRSSAADEDGKEHSFAGMLESYLNVSADESIFRYIKQCYASCFSERIMEYRVQNGLVAADISMGVIIQEMIAPDYAGVIFTTDPRTNNTDDTLISVVAGLGEGLVSGECDSTDYIVDGMDCIVSREIKDGVSLQDDTVIQLRRTGQLIEQSYPVRCPQDIEFCIRSGKIYILQARPITAYSHIDKNKFRTILDNSNIIESYCGVTTPLTFSFAREVYSKIYKQTLRSFSVEEEAIKSIENDLDNMLAFYENRVYYRLNSWYRMTALYPGYEKNKKYMENMMGVKTPLHEKKAHSKTRTVRIYSKFIARLLHIKKSSKEFLSRFNTVTAPYYNNTFEGKTSSELLDIYSILEHEILDDFITPIANDMGTMVIFGMLTDKLKKADIDNYEGLLGSVLSRQGNVESAEQSLMLLDIVQQIKQDERMLSRFETEDTASLISALSSEEPVFCRIRQYLAQYGTRSADELKLETVTEQQDPAFLFETIKNYLHTEQLSYSPEDNGKDGSEAEKKLYAHFGLFSRGYVRLLVRLTKFFIKNRESLRLRRTYIYSIVRSIYLAIGKNLSNDGILENSRDIFWLTKDEVSQIVKNGCADVSALRSTIAQRSSEYSENKSKPARERLYFYGDVTPENALPVFTRQEKAEDSSVLCGVAGGGGVVTGTVRLVEDPREADIEGYILMAKRTDPGWTVVFPMAKAIIIERGSVLSHSAVIAREMGITLVAGVRGLTDRVKDGMTVKVDGINGTVEIIGEENEQRS